MIVNIIIGIVIISVIAVVHELGHYIAAKAFKVGIEEAGLGLPPRIIGKNPNSPFEGFHFEEMNKWNNETSRNK